MNGSAPALGAPEWVGSELVAPAPAKLNLFLHITGRRADGMHELQTLFQFLDWGDRLRLQALAQPRFERATPLPGVDPEADLTLRAARLLAEETGHPGGVRVAVDKQLPMGGGLGGGSSDAATVLLVLNRLWQCGLSPAALAGLGARLGADVPVFIGGTAAWAEGVGERLTPVAELAEPWYLLVWPRGAEVSTAAAFGDPALTRDHATVKITDFYEGRCGNDFTTVVEKRHPEIGRARAWLDEQADAPARLTGSGACVFAPFAERAGAREAFGRVPAGWGAAVARGRNRHPLAEWAFTAVAPPRGAAPV
jgi:4-diphosphocytidyl-2-C-methyl-D-erythritol kinase